jgi:Protein of unknown function (DUF664)
VTATDLLVDALNRIRQIVHRAVDGLGVEQLSYRVDPQTNSIAWLVWHLTRIQDDHVAELAGTEQLWTSDGWMERFDLPFDRSATGFGHSADEVAAVQGLSPEQLTGYHDAVAQQSLGFVQTLTEPDFDRIVDRSWDPAVTLGVRFVSVLSDNLQHAGQAALVRGIVERQ